MSASNLNRQQLIDLIRQTWRTDHAVGPPSFDEEDLILLATGRLEEVPGNRRNDLLRCVASDDELAELVSQLNALGLSDEQHGHAEQPAATRLMIGARYAWAIAACLLLMLGIWRVADPPAPVTIHGTLKPYATEAQSDYWQQLDRQRLVERAERDRVRDYALLGTSIACVVLTIPVVITALRRPQAKTD